MSPGQPLDGVRVVDLTRLIPGGLNGLALADLGASVVKVELPPNGDHLRTWPPMVGEDGALFAVLNRGKQSISFDYRTPEGREQLLALIVEADVLVESFRPGTLVKYGLAYDDLKAVNPALVYCSITGYGQSGAFRDLPSHGLNMDGSAGRLAIHVEETADGPAVEAQTQPGLPAAVLFGGMQAALGICAGLVNARTSGVGCYIDASCWDAALASDPWLAFKHLNGFDTGNYSASRRSPRLAPYLTADDEVLVLCPIEPHLWRRFCEVVNRPDLLGPTTGSDWEKGEEEVYPEVARIIRSKTLAEWQGVLGAAGVPASAVYTMSAALESEQAADRDLLVRSGESDPAFVGRSLVIDGVRTAPAATRWPAMGEDSDQIDPAPDRTLSHEAGEPPSERKGGVRWPAARPR